MCVSIALPDCCLFFLHWDGKIGSGILNSSVWSPVAMILLWIIIGDDVYRRFTFFIVKIFSYVRRVMKIILMKVYYIQILLEIFLCML